MNESIYKKLRDFAESLLAVIIAGSITAIVFSSNDVGIKAMIITALIAGLSAGIAWARAYLANSILPILKDFLTAPKNP